MFVGSVARYKGPEPFTCKPTAVKYKSHEIGENGCQENHDFIYPVCQHT